MAGRCNPLGWEFVEGTGAAQGEAVISTPCTGQDNVGAGHRGLGASVWRFSVCSATGHLT